MYMANIFVSYNRESENITRSLVKDIKALGHTVWFDQELIGGQAWWDQILETIRNSDVFLFVLNPESLNSSACTFEYSYAADLGKIIMPVLISEGVSINLLPPALSQIQLVDYQKRDRDAVLRLAKALTNTPLPQPLPNPLPPQPEVPMSYLGSFTVQVGTKSSLSFEEQSTLLVNLKRGFRDPVTTDDTRTLLERLRNRQDLFATIAEQIDELLKSSAKTTKDSHHVSKTEHYYGKTKEKESDTEFFSRAPRLLWLSIVVYTSFTTVFILSSGRDDHGVGLWFMGISLILIIGSVTSFLGKIRTSKICGIGAFAQIAFLASMLFQSIGDPERIIPLHLGIAGVFLGMMWWYEKERKKKQLTKTQSNTNQA